MTTVVFVSGNTIVADDASEGLNDAFDEQIANIQASKDKEDGISLTYGFWFQEFDNATPERHRQRHFTPPDDMELVALRFYSDTDGGTFTYTETITISDAAGDISINHTQTSGAGQYILSSFQDVHSASSDYKYMFKAGVEYTLEVATTYTGETDMTVSLVFCLRRRDR